MQRHNSTFGDTAANPRLPSVNVPIEVDVELTVSRCLHGAKAIDGNLKTEHQGICRGLFGVIVIVHLPHKRGVPNGCTRGPHVRSLIGQLGTLYTLAHITNPSSPKAANVALAQQLGRKGKTMPAITIFGFDTNRAPEKSRAGRGGSKLGAAQ
ncbi:unnamed protein product [Peniophora sp. CBMAI 1063]|nr:unnamed protein product [Peniophora sp. CBMAI 1063]